MSDNVDPDAYGRIITDKMIVFTQPNASFGANFAWETFKQDYSAIEQRQQLVLRNISHLINMLLPPSTIFGYKCDHCGVIKPSPSITLVGELKEPNQDRTHYTPRWPDDTLLVCDESKCHSKDKFKNLCFAYRSTHTSVETILKSNTNPDVFDIPPLMNPCTSVPEITNIGPSPANPRQIGNVLALIRPTVEHIAPLDVFRENLERGDIEEPTGLLLSDHGALNFAERFVSLFQTLIWKFPHRCSLCMAHFSHSDFLAFQSSERENIVSTLLCSERCLKMYWKQEMTDMYRTNTCLAFVGNQVSAVIFGCKLDDLLLKLQSLKSIKPLVLINSYQDVVDPLKNRAETEMSSQKE
jgi:hypothetical protein